MSKSYAKYISAGYVRGHKRRNPNGKFYRRRVKTLRNKNKMKLRQSIRDNVDFVEVKQCRKDEWMEPTWGTKKIDYRCRNIGCWGAIYVHKKKIRK